MNLLEETMGMMQWANKKPEDVACVAGATHRFTFDLFREVANREYYQGYGSAEVDQRLVVVFKDGSWLERWEYDGSEGWEYKESPAPNLPWTDKPSDDLCFYKERV